MYLLRITLCLLFFGSEPAPSVIKSLNYPSREAGSQQGLALAQYFRARLSTAVLQYCNTAVLQYCSTAVLQYCSTTVLQ